MQTSIARTFSGRFSSGLTSCGLTSAGRISCGRISLKQTSPKRSLWAQPSLEQTSQQRASPRKSWNRQPETRTPDSLLILIPPRTGESRLTNRLGRIEFQRGRGSTEVLRGRKGILRKRGCEPGRLRGTGPGLCELRLNGVLRSSRQTRASVIMQQQGKPQARIIGSCAVSYSLTIVTGQ